MDVQDGFLHMPGNCLFSALLRVILSHSSIGKKTFKLLILLDLFIQERSPQVTDDHHRRGQNCHIPHNPNPDHEILIYDHS